MGGVCNRRLANAARVSAVCDAFIDLHQVGDQMNVWMAQHWLAALAAVAPAIVDMMPFGILKLIFRLK